MNTEKIKEIYLKYELDKEDVFRHQHYVILKLSAIEKISAYESIDIRYEVQKCEKDFAGVKAFATKGDKNIETFGSALKGETYKDGNTNSHYVLEMAEKRSFARATLKILNLYEAGFKSEDESEDFNNIVCVSAFGDKVKQLSALKLGDKMTILCNVYSREYKGKYYHNIDGYHFTVNSKEELSNNSMVTSDDNEDLPF